jgi:hypothetical protein
MNAEEELENYFSELVSEIPDVEIEDIISYVYGETI